MPDISALVLAAGRATRFGSAGDTSKVLALFEGKPLVRWAADAALASRAGEVVVVTGQAEQRVAAVLSAPELRVVHNPDYATGMASSLRVGFSALASDAEGVLVLLADMPLVTAAILDQLIARFQERPGAAVDAIVPTIQGRAGNPVLIGRSMFPAVATLTGDEGARRLLRDPRWRVIFHPVEDDAIERDVDTLAALQTLRRQDRTAPDLSSA